MIFLHLGRSRNLESNMVDPASGASAGEWNGGRDHSTCVGKYSGECLSDY